jgi:hypothetical protein
MGHETRRGTSEIQKLEKIYMVEDGMKETKSET